MELGRLELPTSWVRSRPTRAMNHACLQGTCAAWRPVERWPVSRNLRRSPTRSGQRSRPLARSAQSDGRERRLRARGPKTARSRRRDNVAKEDIRGVVERSLRLRQLHGWRRHQDASRCPSRESPARTSSSNSEPTDRSSCALTGSGCQTSCARPKARCSATMSSSHTWSALPRPRMTCRTRASRRRADVRAARSLRSRVPPHAARVATRIPGCPSRFIDALRGTPPAFPPSLRVKRVVGASGVWEMTYAPDGRATFAYGIEIVPGEPHYHLAPRPHPRRARRPLSARISSTRKRSRPSAGKSPWTSAITAARIEAAAALGRP